MPLTSQQLNELIDERNPSGLTGAPANKRLIELLHALADAIGGASSQVNSDWNATSGPAEIMNKPSLGSASEANSDDFASASQGAKVSGGTAGMPASFFYA